MPGGPAHTRPVEVLMVAIGGYGHYYLEALLDHVPSTKARLAGVVDPEASRARAWPRVDALGVPVCRTMAEFFDAGHCADLTVVVSPPQHHVPQSCAALAHGSDVLCDKPIGATVQESAELIAARDGSGRWVQIGYQWSFSDAIQALKRDILSGLFGAPVRFATLCCWPRDLAYYQRNDWAGRLRHAASGRWVLDGPANNAMAHFLHNALYLAGDRIDRSAVPIRVQAETYRAYAIDAYDTVASRVGTTQGLDILFYASHVSESRIDPMFRLEFEHTTVTFGGSSPSIVATDSSGRTREYGAPDATSQFKKLFDAIDAAGGPAPAVCGPEAAAAQTLAVNGLHESVPEAASFPSRFVVDDASAGRRYVRTLGETLLHCYDAGELPREAGIDWSEAGRAIDLTGYNWYPRGETVHAQRR